MTSASPPASETVKLGRFFSRLWELVVLTSVVAVVVTGDVATYGATGVASMAMSLLYRIHANVLLLHEKDAA